MATYKVFVKTAFDTLTNTEQAYSRISGWQSKVTGPRLFLLAPNIRERATIMRVIKISSDDTQSSAIKIQTNCAAKHYSYGNRASFQMNIFFQWGWIKRYASLRFQVNKCAVL